ncbi:MAG TPA: SGNH/GDSL hydrolase family protein [Chloroflexota bacterium]|nr:SGNH/GDSL hydrolase family protein [Chloroflexota bacterium]
MAGWSGAASIPARDVLARVVIVLMLLVVLAVPLPPGGPAIAATMVQGGFTTSGTVSVANISPGGSVVITARVTSATNRTMLVDVEIYSPTGVAPLQQFVFDNEMLMADVERTFPVTWSAPAGAATGGYTVKIGVFDSNWGQNRHWNDGASFFTVGMGSQPPAGGPIRIMPLGDSLTDGFTVDGGYRIDLWTMLTFADQSFDFVGSRHNGVPALGDKHHEGHSGWRIDQIAEAATPWLQAYRPQIVLLMIGTNDMLQNYEVNAAPSRLSALIDQIRTAVPDAAIVVSSLPRVSNLEALGRIQAYNSQIPGIVASKGSKVSYVDAYTAIEAAHLAVDGVHLTHNGYGKLATVWYPTVLALVTTLTPSPTPTLTPTPTPTLSPCSPRPRILVSTARGEPGRLVATIAVTGAGNGLRELRFGEVKNALVTVAGQSGRAGLVVTLPGMPTSVAIGVTRERAAEPVHVPLVVVDQCGDWSTFVGGGPTAF